MASTVVLGLIQAREDVALGLKMVDVRSTLEFHGVDAKDVGHALSTLVDLLGPHLAPGALDAFIERPGRLSAWLSAVSKEPREGK